MRWSGSPAAAWRTCSPCSRCTTWRRCSKNAGRPAWTTKLIAQQRLPECYATDNGTAVTSFGTTFHEAVSETPDARAWHLTRNDDGTVREEPLPTRLLSGPYPSQQVPSSPS